MSSILHRSIRALSRAALVLVVAQASGLAGQAPAPITGTSRPQGAEQRVQPSLPVFEFYSGFWLNLHHFLYYQARQVRSGTPVVFPPETTPEEKQAWNQSVDYYLRTLAGQDLLFNGDMVNIKNRLAEMQGQADLQKSGLRPELVTALEAATPIYRARWWPAHDASNRAWVATVAPLVQQFGGTLSERLAHVYQEQWPAGRMRVDVTYYADGAGAYTTLDPLHITISSSDPRNQDFAALEILFHEASHALAGAVREGIIRECRTRNKPIPRDLWHAVLFYTTGEMVRRTLGGPDGPLARRGASKEQPAGYTPYAYQQGLYQRGWQNYLQALERHWLPYLNGQIDFDRALARLVAAL